MNIILHDVIGLVALVAFPVFIWKLLSGKPAQRSRGKRVLTAVLILCVVGLMFRLLGQYAETHLSVLAVLSTFGMLSFVYFLWALGLGETEIGRSRLLRWIGVGYSILWALTWIILWLLE
jgi:hypothetical protein